MSTPGEGPALWQQGSWSESADYLRNLTPQQQRNLQLVLNMTPQQAERLDRVLNKVPMRERIHTTVGNAVARVQMVYAETSRRLSDAAQTLATQANQYRDAAAARVDQFGQQVAGAYQDGRAAVVDAAQEARLRAVEFGQDVAATVREGRDAVVQGAQTAATRVNEFGQQVAGAARDGRDAVVQGARDAGQAVAQGARDAGQAVARGAANTRDAVVTGGRQAVAAGQRVAGNVSRWFEDRKNNAVVRAEGARAAFAAFRHDPTQPGISPKDLAQLSQQFSRVLAAPNLEARTAAIEAMAASNRAQIDATNMAKALGGVAPANQMTQAGAATGQAARPAGQTGPNLTKSHDDRNGPTR